MDFLSEHLAAAVRRAMERGVTQGDLAGACGIQPSVLSRFMDGEEPLSVEDYGRVMAALGGHVSFPDAPQPPHGVPRDEQIAALRMENDRLKLELAKADEARERALLEQEELFFGASAAVPATGGMRWKTMPPHTPYPRGEE